MKNRIWLGVGMAMAFAASAIPASAEQVGADHQKIVALLQAKGYKAERIEGADADYIRTADSGVPVTIFFLNCAKGKTGCTTIQFYTGFSDIDATLESMNLWNRDHRWARAYIEKDPVLEMDVDMDFGGLSRELFYDNLETFIALVPRFRDHLKK
jgi:hypothetical protein